MKKFHIAISVSNLEKSIVDYTHRLGQNPQIVIQDEYALWRTETLNFSIRKSSEQSGMLRHLGWEDSSVAEFSKEVDSNNIVWERFNEGNQLQEIERIWPEFQQK